MIYNSTPKNTQNPQFAGARILGSASSAGATPRAQRHSCCAPTWARRTTRSHQRRKLRKLSRVPQVGRSGRLAPRRGRAPSGSTTCSHSAASRHCFLSGLSTAAFNQLHAHRVHTVCTAAAARRRLQRAQRPHRKAAARNLASKRRQPSQPPIQPIQLLSSDRRGRHHSPADNPFL